MAQGTDKIVKIHNKSDRPDNIVETENEIDEECEKLETQMPRFLRSFFIYLRGNVLPMTRLAYLRDIRFFLKIVVRISKNYSNGKKIFSQSGIILSVCQYNIRKMTKILIS